MYYKAYKYRIYPNKKQRKLFAQTFGCVRFVYNFFFSMCRQEYAVDFRKPDKKQCSSELTALKAEPGYEWLNDVDSTALQSSLSDLDEAYKRFFNGAGFPKYKSKKEHRDSYTAKNNNSSITMSPKKIKLPKTGWVKTKVSRPTEGRILSATVSRNPAGKYYVSVLCEVPEMRQVKEPVQDGMPGWSLKGRRAVGIDMGIANYLTAYDGTDTYEVANPSGLDNALGTLARRQRSLSRKTIGSRRFMRQRQLVASAHEDVANRRKDFLQKLSTAIVMEYDIICVEDLDVKGMMLKTSRQAEMSNHAKQTRDRHIMDAAWGIFLQMLEYKCKWYGKTLVKVSRYYPSTQLCSSCGTKNPDVKDTSVREWVCPACGAKHGRDENAARNILAEGLRVYQEALSSGVAVFGAAIKADELNLSQASA